MSDRDYNSPEYDRPNYETAEEYNRARREREEQMAEESQNSYGEGYSSYNYENYNNRNANRVYSGSAMTDATGKPLKNYFALKLTISIMMIMGCCCSNMILVILGIIALVFTCKANSAYNNGNAEEFQKQSKVATVLLWVGGGFLIIYLIMGIFILVSLNLEIKETTGKNLLDVWEMIEDEIDIEDLLSDFEDYDGLEDPESDVQYIDDRTTSLPMTYDRFLETGFELEDFSSKTEVEPGDLEYYSFKMYSVSIEWYDQ